VWEHVDILVMLPIQFDTRIWYCDMIVISLTVDSLEMNIERS